MTIGNLLRIPIVIKRYKKCNRANITNTQKVVGKL